MTIPGLTGGTEAWEMAQAAARFSQTLPEFEQRPQEEQDWGRALWRTEQKLEILQLRQMGRRHGGKQSLVIEDSSR